MPATHTLSPRAALAAWLVLAGCLPDFEGRDDDGSDDDAADDDASPADDDVSDDDASDDDGSPADDDVSDDDASDDDGSPAADDVSDDDVHSTPEEDLALVDFTDWDGEELNHLDFNAQAEIEGYFDCTWEWDVTGTRDTSTANCPGSVCQVIYHVEIDPRPDDCFLGSYADDYWYGFELTGDREGRLWSKGTNNGGWVEWCTLTLHAEGEISYQCPDGGSGTIGDEGAGFVGEVEGTASLS